MKDKRLRDIEDKIKNDVLKGTFNLGDESNPNSVIGMAMSFLRGPNNLESESEMREASDLSVAETNVEFVLPAGADVAMADEAQEPREGSYIPFGRLGGVGVTKCDCGCWEGQICTNSKRIIK